MNTLPEKDFEKETEAKTENAALVEMDLVKMQMELHLFCCVESSSSPPRPPLHKKTTTTRSWRSAKDLQSAVVHLPRAQFSDAIAALKDQGRQIAAMVPGTVQLNMFTWNKRLAEYVKTRQAKKAMQLFQHLQQDGMKPDKFTFVQVLNACASHGGCTKSVQQDAIMDCCLLDCPDYKTCEMWTRAQDIGTL
ncbi:unnamed protein product [Sphagnum troendelagicum]